MSDTRSCDNASWGTLPSDVTSIQTTHTPTCQALSAIPHVSTHQNYYHSLVFDEDCIAVDSGASDGFGTEETPGTDRRATDYGVTMASATGDCRTSIATDKFDLPLPQECLDYHVFKKGDLQRPLLSVGKACDAGCKVTFDATNCEFTKQGVTLLRGYRDKTSGLYLLPKQPRNTIAMSGRCIPFPKDHVHDTRQPLGLGLPRQRVGLSAYEMQSIPQLMRYLHACAGYPTPATWIKAINQGYYISWPGLTASRVRKHLKKSEITTLGHLKLTPQGVRSTSKGAPEVEDTTTEPEEDDTDEPRNTAINTGRQRRVGACSIPLKGIMGTDQTGRFPVTSRRGHKYIFILYDVDTEYIHGVPIKSRSATEIVRAFDEAYQVLVTCGFEPILHRTDHETSDKLIKAIKNKKLNYELVPPGNHRRNPAERAIQTYKSHFISILNGIHPNYAKDAWDHLIPQTNMTVNMLRPCAVNPAHSAYSYIHGAFDFDAHPLAPLGCRSIVHQRSVGNGGKRGSWANRGEVGYYVGPAMDSYRVWRFYMPSTRRIQETDTAQFFPNEAIPHISTAVQIAASLDTIKDALNNPRPPYNSIHEMQEHDRMDVVIARLRHMYGLESPGAVAPSTEPTHVRTPTRAGTIPNTKSPITLKTKQTHKAKQTMKDTPVPRVQDTTDTINTYRPRKKQRYPLGTRVRIVEKQGGKREVLIGTAEKYDPYTGIYHVTFDDGEYEEFDDDEMEYFLLVKPYKGRKPTTSANQLTIPGFHPKATRSPISHIMKLDKQYDIIHGLNAGSIWDDELHKWMAYRDLIKHPNKKIRERWNQAGMNEFARLTQGHGDTEGLDVITFIHKQDMPPNKRATYARYVVDYRPEKDEPWRLRITCGGDKLDYHGDTTTHSASMEVIKLQLNSIISTEGAKCATGDISNMYLNSDLPEAEYVRFRVELIPNDFIKAYELTDMIATDGYIYAKVNKAWYGLKQAGRIAHDDLVKHLEDAGYKKAPLVEGYFRHESRPIDFTLVVDDFLIKYTRQEDLDHLQDTIGNHYTFKVDPDAKQYVGINLKWDYDRRTVRLCMDGYVQQALTELEHQAPSHPYHGPSRYTPPQYGAKVQYARIDETAPLHKSKITFIQRAVGKLLYYARAVDPTMLHAINDISLSASKGTAATLDATMYLLNYAYTYPDAEIIYRASEMELQVDSDAAYLVAPEARSRAGGYQYLGNRDKKLFNGPVLVIAKVIKNVMASAAEAELAALFMNAQEAAGLRNCLEAMGFPQPATPLKTDNSTANGIINNTMKQKRSKAIDVRFYWLRDRVKQGQFFVYWESGKTNFADYHTKHHPPAYYKKHRPLQTYIEGLSPESLQGCIRIMNSDLRGGQTKIDKKNNLNSKRLTASLTDARCVVDSAHNIQ